MTIRKLKEIMNKAPEEILDSEIKVVIGDNDIIHDLLCDILGDEYVNNAKDDDEKVNKTYSYLCDLLKCDLKSCQARSRLFEEDNVEYVLIGDNYFS